MNSVRIIRESFQTVAVEFNLNIANCPTHPSFITNDKLYQLKQKGLKFFGLFIDDVQIGFVAIESAGKGIYYMEKLAVLPEHRHYGYGKLLIGHACEYIKDNNGKVLSIGIINESAILKKWYLANNFTETGTKKFDHLPFTVCFMERKINRISSE